MRRASVLAQLARSAGGCNGPRSAPGPGPGRGRESLLQVSIEAKMLPGPPQTLPRLSCLGVRRIGSPCPTSSPCWPQTTLNMCMVACLHRMAVRQARGMPRSGLGVRTGAAPRAAAAPRLSPGTPLAPPPPAARGLNGAPTEGQPQLGGALAAAARGMAAHGTPPAVVPNPLQQIVPPVRPGGGGVSVGRSCRQWSCISGKQCGGPLREAVSRVPWQRLHGRRLARCHPCGMPNPSTPHPSTPPSPTPPRPTPPLTPRQIIKGVKAGVDGVKAGIPAAWTALANSGMTRSAIAYFADNVRG
jgi:hypothetical protein